MPYVPILFATSPVRAIRSAPTTMNSIARLERKWAYGAVRNDLDRDPVAMKLPRREAHPLKVRAGLAGEDADSFARFVRGADDAERGAVAPRGERPGVAVGEDRRPLRDLARADRPHRATGGDVFHMNRARLGGERLQTRSACGTPRRPRARGFPTGRASPWKFTAGSARRGARRPGASPRQSAGGPSPARVRGEHHSVRRADADRGRAPDDHPADALGDLFHARHLDVPFCAGSRRCSSIHTTSFDGLSSTEEYAAPLSGPGWGCALMRASTRSSPGMRPAGSRSPPPPARSLRRRGPSPL